MTVRINGSTGYTNGDNIKLKLGASDDLQIYHDGSNSYIKDAGTGAIRFLNSQVAIKDDDGNENVAVFNPQGDCQLYYDNSLKLATTSTGIDVTGTVTADVLIVESGNTNVSAQFKSADTTVKIGLSDDTSTTTYSAALGAEGDELTFYSGASTAERMRIDTNGNLLVNKTSVDNATIGIMLKAGGQLSAVVQDAAPLFANRTNSDGDILLLRKDNTTVGSIGVVGGDILYIANPDGSDVGFNFDGDNPKINPCNGTGSGTDGVADLGHSGGRYKDLYLSGGVYLGGTGSANYVDDYEEGVLNWKLQRSDQVAGSNNSSTKVTYTKIGSRVHISGYIYTQSTGSTTGVQVRLLNTSDNSNATLPFVPNHNGVLQVGHTRTMDPHDGLMSIAFAKNSATVYVYQNSGTGDYVADSNNVDISNTQTHLVITFQGVYSTDS